MLRSTLILLLAGATLAACVPSQRPPPVIAAPQPPAPPKPRVEPARAISLLYQHRFAESLARRLAGACPAITVNEGAISSAGAEIRATLDEAGLSDADVRERLSAAQGTRLAGDLSAFTSQTGIRFSDPASNCTVARGQIAGGSRIGAYLSALPDTAIPPEPAPAAESIAADALTAIDEAPDTGGPAEPAEDDPVVIESPIAPPEGEDQGQ